MSIRKVMMMFALMTGIICAGHAQEVKNDSTATTKAEELKLVKEVCPQTEEDGDLYHGLTRKLMFDRMIPPHGLEVTYDKTVHILFPRQCAMWTWARLTLSRARLTVRRTSSA